MARDGQGYPRRRRDMMMMMMILFVIKFMINLFFIFFFLIFVNLLLTSCKAPVFVFLFFYVEPQVLTQRSRLLLCHFVAGISPFTGPREKATFLFLDEARNCLFVFHFFWAVKTPSLPRPMAYLFLIWVKTFALLGCFFHCC